MFRMKIADQVFEIDNHYSDIVHMSRDYVTEETPSYVVGATVEEIEAEDREQKGFSLGYLETLAIYRKICDLLREKDTFLFHCSAIEMDGKAYLFTAPSGTGKSTHTRLWREVFGDKVTMINDDKPLLHLAENEIVVYGTPWSGKEQLQTNTSAPVAGIVILHQAMENKIRRIEAREAYPMLLNQTHRGTSADGMKYTLDFVWRLAQVPVYSLGCTISKEAVLLAHQSLTESK